MARNTYDTCRAIMIDLQGRGFEQEATRHEVLNSVVAVAGETKATRDRYMNALKRHGFVTQTGPASFTLHIEKADNDGEMSLIGDLTRRITQVETILSRMRKGPEGEHDG